MIEIKNLVYEYPATESKTKQAIKGINMKIMPGEFVVILGHNGSGKSTLAKHLNAIFTPTSGDVLINGMNTKDENKLWDIRKTAGMVFQNPDNQIVATVVEEDVAFGPENIGLPKEEIRHRVDTALKSVDMTEYKKKSPANLSGGQKQRVAIAGIIAMKPECIILDEPTAMLDPIGRKEVMDTVTYLNKKDGITLVHITHYMEEAVNADRIIVMDEGEIVMEGEPRKIFQKVEELKKIGLDVPPMTELAYKIHLKDPSFPTDILTVEEMSAALIK